MSDPREYAIARQHAQEVAFQKAFVRIRDCELFRDTVTEFEYASADVRNCTDESQPQRAAAMLLDRMMNDMVYAVADYHCARNVIGALQALDGEDIT